MDLIKALKQAIDNKDWLKALELLAEHSDYYSAALKNYGNVVMDVIHNALATGADPETVVSLAARLGVTPDSFQDDLEKALINLAFKEPGKALEECNTIGVCSDKAREIIEALNDKKVYEFVVNKDRDALVSFTPRDWEALKKLIDYGVVSTDYEADRRYAAEKIFTEIVGDKIENVPRALEELVNRGYTEYTGLLDFVKNPSVETAKTVLSKYHDLGPAAVLWAAKKLTDEGRYAEAAQLLRLLGVTVPEKRVDKATLEKAEEYLAYTILGAILAAIKAGNAARAVELLNKYGPYLEKYTVTVNGKTMSMANYVKALLEAQELERLGKEAKNINDALKFYRFVLDHYGLLKKIYPELPPKEALEELLDIYQEYLDAQRLFEEGHIRAASEKLHDVLSRAESLAKRYPELAPPLLGILVTQATPEDIECVLRKAGLWPPGRGLPPKGVKAVRGGMLAAM